MSVKFTLQQGEKMHKFLILLVLAVMLCGTAYAEEQPTTTQQAISLAAVDLPLIVEPQANNVNGQAVSVSYTSSAASTNATLVAARTSNVYFIHVTNTTAVIYYLRMYNLAVAPTCSSLTGFVETIPVNATNQNGRSVAFGMGYSTGVGFCITGGGGNNDNTNAAAGVYVTIGYK